MTRILSLAITLLTAISPVFADEIVTLDDLVCHGDECGQSIEDPAPIYLITDKEFEPMAERVDHLERMVLNLETLVLRLYIGDVIPEPEGGE